MGRPPKAPAMPDDAPVEASPKMVLKKNHGLLIDGRHHKFFAAGTEFDLGADAELIAALIRSGGIFE